MVFVHVDSVVVLSSSITTTSWMFPVLANTSVTSTDVTPLFPVLVQVCTAGISVSVCSSLPVWTVHFTKREMTSSEVASSFTRPQRAQHLQ